MGGNVGLPRMLGPEPRGRQGRRCHPAEESPNICQWKLAQKSCVSNTAPRQNNTLALANPVKMFHLVPNLRGISSNNLEAKPAELPGPELHTDRSSSIPPSFTSSFNKTDTVVTTDAHKVSVTGMKPQAFPREYWESCRSPYPLRHNGGGNA